MRKYKFKLEALLKYRKFNEYKAKTEVAQTLKKIHQLKNDSAFKAWMFRILTNAFISQRRRERATG